MSIAKQGPQIFEVFIENKNKFYHQGERIQGRVILGIKRPLRTNVIYLEWKGEVYVHFTIFNSGDQEERHFTDNLELFSQTIVIFGSFLTRHLTEIPSGYHEYDFEVSIPFKLPASMDAEFGGVRFTLQSFIKRPAATFDFKSGKAFIHVLGKLDLNLFPRAAYARTSEQDKNICCFCCKAGPIHYTFRVKKRGFIASEKIRYHVVVHNPTMRKIHFKISLIQKRSFTATAPAILGPRTEVKVVEELICQDIRILKRKDTQEWNGALPIPEDTPPSWLGRRKISPLVCIEYFVRVHADIPWTIDVREDILILIGTIQLKSFPNEDWDFKKYDLDKLQADVLDEYQSKFKKSSVNSKYPLKTQSNIVKSNNTIARAKPRASEPKNNVPINARNQQTPNKAPQGTTSQNKP